MCEVELPSWVQTTLTVLSFLLFALFERWLGRTPQTKAASTLDLIGSLVSNLVTKRPRGFIKEETDKMLEGNEFEKNLGTYGKVVVDVKPTLEITASASFDAKAALKDVAAKTDKSWLRGAINFLIGFVEEPKSDQAPEA